MEVFRLDLCPVYVGCVCCVGTEVSAQHPSVQPRVGVTIVPTRYLLPRSVLDFKQSSFHLVEIALENPPV